MTGTRGGVRNCFGNSFVRRTVARNNCPKTIGIFRVADVHEGAPGLGFTAAGQLHVEPNHVWFWMVHLHSVR